MSLPARDDRKQRHILRLPSCRDTRSNCESPQREISRGAEGISGRRRFMQIFFAGYSMGGNLITKMAGEYGSAAPRALRGVCAICPAMDLASCADALNKRENYFTSGTL